MTDASIPATVFPERGDLLTDLWPVPLGEPVSPDQTLLIPHREPELSPGVSPLFTVRH